MGRSILYFMLALAVAAIGVGLYLTGGPIQARREAMDEARMEDLRDLSAILQCSYKLNRSNPLPTELSVETLATYCPSLNTYQHMLVDPETGETYRYTRISESTYSVCADFNDPSWAWETTGTYLATGTSFNVRTGCLSGALE